VTVDHREAKGEKVQNSIDSEGRHAGSLQWGEPSEVLTQMSWHDAR
jgi:hypothetical protein